jgi:lipid-binding SYLF domain-containing protein
MGITRYIGVLVAALCLMSGPVRADDLTDNFVRVVPTIGEVNDQISGLATDLRTIINDKVPSALLRDAQAITVAYLKKGGFFVAIETGNGLMVVRNKNRWSNPAFVKFSSASFGWQGGIEAKTVVLVCTKRKAATKLLTGNLQLKAGLNLAVGPLATDVGTQQVFDKKCYSYSDGVGLFAGLSLEGSSVSLDPDYNEGCYGGAVTASQIFKDRVKTRSRAAKNLRSYLDRATK